MLANGLLTLAPVSKEEEKLKLEPPPAPNDTGWVPFTAGLEPAPGKLCDWPNVNPFEMLGGWDPPDVEETVFGSKEVKGLKGCCAEEDVAGEFGRVRLLMALILKVKVSRRVKERVGKERERERCSLTKKDEAGLGLSNTIKK